MGEGQTTANLYARTQPAVDAPTVTLWASGTTILLWYAFGLWYYVSDLACKLFGWSNGSYIKRTL